MNITRLSPSPMHGNPTFGMASRLAKKGEKPKKGEVAYKHKPFSPPGSRAIRLIEEDPIAARGLLRLRASCREVTKALNTENDSGSRSNRRGVLMSLQVVLRNALQQYKDELGWPRNRSTQD